jgi:hypothetical protein
MADHFGNVFVKIFTNILPKFLSKTGDASMTTGSDSKTSTYKFQSCKMFFWGENYIVLAQYLI